MLSKSSVLLLVLAVSQVFATSLNVLQLRGLEILQSRQSGCPVCNTVSQTLTNCATSAPTAITQCACTPSVRSQVQSCVDCGLAANATVAKQITDAYAQMCKDSPTVTNPGSSGATGVSKASSGTSDKGKWAGVAAIGAFFGAALVL